MALIYSAQNKVVFTDISERYSVPKKFKARLSEVHGALIMYVVGHFQNTRKYRQKVVDALNILTYCIMFNETPPFDWRVDNPLDTVPSEFDLDVIAESLGDYFLTDESIEWNIEPVEIVPRMPEHTQTSIEGPKPKLGSAPAPRFTSKESDDYLPKRSIRASVPATSKNTKQWLSSFTPKEDLYIQSPKYPTFDYANPWLLQTDEQGEKFAIYRTLPEIPTKQNEISITTDVDKMTESELMDLFPNHIVQTRPAVMYERHPGMEYDDDLGCIIPIQGFSSKQVIDNIIRYPHLYKLKRLNEDVLSSFYQDIELDGELLSVSAIWDTIPESEVIPRQSDFIKEYVVRRYLLERDAGVKHSYPMYGTLDPYLTLFMPAAKYAERGYTNLLEIVKQCVRSRVSFKQSRNPILKRLHLNG